MSAQTFADAFALVEAKYREQVMGNTWGHLAPKRNKTYRGHIVFALGCFGDDHLNPTVLECKLGNLDSSPWFFDTMIDFLSKQETEAGNVYRFDGVFRNYEFTGTTRKLLLVTETTGAKAE